MLPENMELNIKFGLHGRLNEQELAALKAGIHQKFIDNTDLAGFDKLDRRMARDEIQKVMSPMLLDTGIVLSARVRDEVVDSVVDEILGFGPIQPLLDDPSITEIMVNGPKQVYIERDGKIFPAAETFRDDAHVMRIIEKIIMPLGRRIDESSPMVDARLPDGSRVNAIIPPLAIKGPTVTVRKFSVNPYSIEDLIEFGTLTREMATFLRGCVVSRLNMIVSGGTGSGKTTTLNVLSSFVPNNERIITIEDAAELRLQQKHVVTLESRPANLEGTGEITIRMLLRNALRMRPDRLIVGEVRGGEALDMLQAMNTGHNGSLSTTHTNSPRDTISRLETMALMAGTELPARAIREQMSAAVNLIIHQTRLQDGTRKITHITEVQGMEGEVIVLQNIFNFEQQGIDESGKVIGRHVPSGLRPKCMEVIEKHGINMPMDIFEGKC